MFGEIVSVVVFLAGGYLLGDQIGLPWGGVLLGALLFVAVRNLHFSQFAAGLRDGVRPWLVGQEAWRNLFEQTAGAHQQERPSESPSLSPRLIHELLALPFGVIFIDGGNAVRQFNSRAEVLFNLKNPDDVGANLTHLVRQPDFIRALEHKDSVSSMVLQHYSEKKLLIHVLPCRDMRLVLIQDVTELHRMERARRKLAANISHELRTPLTIIRGYVETLQGLSENQSLPPGFSEAIAEIVQYSAQMNDIIENSLFLDQLDSRKPDKSEWTRVDVKHLVNNMIAAEQVHFKEKKCRVKTEIDSSRLLFGNEHELYSAFSNLLNNALRHSADGGEVLLSWQVDDEGGHFSVVDKGEGIDSGEIAFLTERFYRVDYARADKHGGTGLGLAIVKHVLSRHGASLSIDSEVGKGSVFRCDFPPSCLLRDDQSAETSGDV